MGSLSAVWMFKAQFTLGNTELQRKLKGGDLGLLLPIHGENSQSPQ